MTNGVRPNRPTVLVHSIRLPQHKMGIGFAVLIGVGIGIGWMIPGGLALLVTAWVWNLLAGPNAPKPVWLYAPAILSGALLTIAWIVLVEYWARASHLKRTQARHDRLERIAARPDAAIRLPHRLIELAYRNYMRQLIQNPRAFVRKLADILSRAPRGVAVVVILGPKGILRPPIPTDVAFEPSEVARLNPQLLALLTRTWPEYTPPDAGEGVGPESSRDRSRGPLLPWAGLKRGIRGVIGCAICAGAVCWFVWTLDWEILLVVGGLLFLALVMPRARLFAGRTWWVVPRGLVYRDHRLWRKDVRVRMITRAKASVVVETRGRGYVLDGNELLRCQWWPQNWPEQRSVGVGAIIAAWVSNAPAPTTEQVLAFVGPDARLIE